MATRSSGSGGGCCRNTRQEAPFGRDHQDRPVVAVAGKLQPVVDGRKQLGIARRVQQPDDGPAEERTAGEDIPVLHPLARQARIASTFIAGCSRGLRAFLPEPTLPDAHPPGGRRPPRPSRRGLRGGPTTRHGAAVRPPSPSPSGPSPLLEAHLALTLPFSGWGAACARRALGLSRRGAEPIGRVASNGDAAERRGSVGVRGRRVLVPERAGVVDQYASRNAAAMKNGSSRCPRWSSAPASNGPAARGICSERLLSVEARPRRLASVRPAANAWRTPRCPG